MKKFFIAPPNIQLKDIFLNIRLLLAFGLGSGTVSFAPGTMGTCVALLIYYILPVAPLEIYVFLWWVAFLSSVYLAHYAEKFIGVSDYSGIVCDEFVGFWLVTFMLPPGILWLTLAFLLFRFFDITKPWPIHHIEHWPGGWGCVMDDIIAGIYVWLVLHTLLWVYTLSKL